jgi:hypothetical protein
MSIAALELGHARGLLLFKLQAKNAPVGADQRRREASSTLRAAAIPG